MTFKKSYRVRMKFCMMRWNATHISKRYRDVHGALGVQIRENWQKNIHNRVFHKNAVHKYIENRGRKALHDADYEDHDF